jgi:hypothetical protein
VARSRLIFDEHQRIADWCEARIVHFSGWGSEPRAIGYEVNGIIKGGVVYTNYSPGNVFASIALDGPINRRFLYAIFYNPFIAWKVRHISCTIEESNVKSINLCTRMGFSQEGRMRESAVNGEDVIVMGMLKREAERWLKVGPKLCM